MPPKPAVSRVINKLAKQPPSAALLLKNIWAHSAPQMHLKLSQGYEDSAYVLSYEIRQREGGFYSARTDTQTQDPVPY